MKLINDMLKKFLWAVDLAQLVERLLLTPEICNSHLVIGNLIYYHL